MPPPPKFTSKQAIIKFEEFLATIRTNEGYAPTNRFEVLLNPPAGAGVATPNELTELSLRCKGVTLPGRNLNTLTDSNIYGPTREIVDGVTYAADIAMTFIASGPLWERVFFEKWQQLAFNNETWDLGYYNDYIGEVDIFILNRQNERRFGIRLKEAFPKTISPTELSMESQNEIILLPVDFAFRYWESLEIVRNTVVGYAGGMGFKVNSDDMSPEEWTYWAHAIPVTRSDGHGQRTYPSD
jgi:hypothetical protein